LQEYGVNFGRAAIDQLATNITTGHSQRIEERDKLGFCGSSASILGKQKMMNKLLDKSLGSPRLSSPHVCGPSTRYLATVIGDGFEDFFGASLKSIIEWVRI
jgi:hypothetical protein